MPKSVAQLRRRLSRVKPWVAVAVLLGVALVGYSSVLGMRYLNASDEVALLNTQSLQLSVKLRQKPPDVEALEANQESQEQRLDAVRRLFGPLETRDLLDIVFATAQKSGVSLERLGVGQLKAETRDEVRFRIQPISATLKGQTLDIYGFVALLQEKLPVVSVVSLNMSGLEASTTAQVQLLFFISAEATPEE